MYNGRIDMTSEKLIDLKNKLVNNEISTEEALDILYTKKTRSWHTKEWKTLRDKILKDACEQCGSTEVLTIQHIWHPRDYKTMRSDILQKYNTERGHNPYDIEREIAFTIIDESLRYNSLADTKTFCNRCAFMWDEKGMDLCPVCKTNYKKFYHSMCMDCTKEENRKNGNNNATNERLVKILDKIRKNS
jgi:hypothetical protein